MKEIYFGEAGSISCRMRERERGRRGGVTVGVWAEIWRLKEEKWWGKWAGMVFVGV